jgi:hypothetical protein
LTCSPASARHPCTNSVHEHLRRARLPRPPPDQQSKFRLQLSSQRAALCFLSERALSFVHSFRTRLGVSFYPASASEFPARSPASKPHLPRVSSSTRRQWRLLRCRLGLSLRYTESSTYAAASRLPESSLEPPGHTATELESVGSLLESRTRAWKWKVSEQTTSIRRT